MSKRTWIAAATAAVIAVPVIAWGWQDELDPSPPIPDVGSPDLDAFEDISDPPAAPPEPEAFLEQNRQLVDQRVADLSDEYKTLHAQMQQVEATLRHWQRIQQALASVDNMAASPVATPTSERSPFDLDTSLPPLRRSSPSEPQLNLKPVPVSPPSS